MNHCKGSHYPDLPNPLPVILRKRMTWDGLLAFLHTQSPLHAYHEKYPEDRNRGDGNIAERFVRQLKEETGEVCKGSDPVDVEWPLALILVKKS
jgi:trans-aconitate 3-methyltransferase